jgi:mannitol-1-/sugar-/sorbitol-6-phosphatase
MRVQFCSTSTVCSLIQTNASSGRGVTGLMPTGWMVTQSCSVRTVATFRIAVGGLPMPSVLLTADDVARGKPDPEGYLRAAELLGIPPQDCVIVEDAPAGLAAGRAAGMRAIGVRSTFAETELHDAEFVVASVAELLVETRGATLRIVMLRGA